MVDECVETDESDRLRARSENGTIYIVVEYQRIITTRMMAGALATVPRTFYELEDGRTVPVTGKDNRAEMGFLHRLDDGLICLP